MKTSLVGIIILGFVTTSFAQDCLPFLGAQFTSKDPISYGKISARLNPNLPRGTVMQFALMWPENKQEGFEERYIGFDFSGNLASDSRNRKCSVSTEAQKQIKFSKEVDLKAPFD